MIRIKYLYLLFFLNLLFNTTNGLSIENKILFKVKEEIITTVDISNEIKYLKLLNKNLSNIDKNQMFEISKKSLVREKVKKNELLKYYDNLEIENEILEPLILKFFKTKIEISSILEFENYFKEIKINPNGVREKIIIDLLWKQLIYQKYRDKVYVDENLIKNELENSKVINEFLLSEIVFDLKENESLENKFKKIKKTIDEFSFAKAANVHSISDSANSGGLLGWVSETSINKKIREELYKKKNDYTKPIVIPGGFLILKIEDQRKKEKDINIEQQIKIISEKKINQQLERYSIIHINKIKKNLKIYEL